MDVREGDVITLAAAAPIPEGSTIDCAIAGLFRNADGTISAQIFIPGPAVP